MEFYVGLHQPSDAKHFDRCMISVHRLAKTDPDGRFVYRDGRPVIRRKPIPGGVVMVDAGAFTKIDTYGGYPDAPERYGEVILEIAAQHSNAYIFVCEDWMCEPMMLKKTGLSVADHQRRTIERYDAIRAVVKYRVRLMPVIQGFTPAEYLSHIDQYGHRLMPGMWAGVGSVCKRRDLRGIENVLGAVHQRRPDLRLHGFGVKLTALKSILVRDMLYSADSMAWSYASRKSGRGGNNYRDAISFCKKIDDQLPKPRNMGMYV